MKRRLCNKCFDNRVMNCGEYIGESECFNYDFMVLAGGKGVFIWILNYLGVCGLYLQKKSP